MNRQRGIKVIHGHLRGDTMLDAGVVDQNVDIVEDLKACSNRCSTDGC